MTGSDRFKRRSWALVVVGSLRKEAVDVFWPSSRRRGVEGGGIDWTEDGVEGVGMLDRDDCAECPSRDWDFRARLIMGPPLSETGSRDDAVCVRSWVIGRGSREVPDVGLLVKVMDTAALGREGLAGRVSLSRTLR